MLSYRLQKLGNGRDPKLYGEHAREFFAAAKEAGKPFFLMANAQDPHRPFARSNQQRAQDKRRKFPGVRRAYKPAEVNVPKFLPDIPDVRLEISEYYTSVHRCDEVVGSLLNALDDAGQRENTIVIFLSDHGMALPFAKTNCYFHSTRTPLLIRWPNVVKPGQTDETHFVSTIDLAPTILAALQLEAIEDVDGRSFMPLLRGEKQDKPRLRFHHVSPNRWPAAITKCGRLSKVATDTSGILGAMACKCFATNRSRAAR